MTHLRKIMLEELQRRNYSEATTRLLHSHGRSFRPTLPAALPIAWARSTFASTKLTCSRNGSCHPVR